MSEKLLTYNNTKILKLDASSWNALDRGEYPYDGTDADWNELSKDRRNVLIQNQGSGTVEISMDKYITDDFEPYCKLYHNGTTWILSLPESTGDIVDGNGNVLRGTGTYFNHTVSTSGSPTIYKNQYVNTILSTIGAVTTNAGVRTVEVELKNELFLDRNTVTKVKGFRYETETPNTSNSLDLAVNDIINLEVSHDVVLNFHGSNSVYVNQMK